MTGTYNQGIYIDGEFFNVPIVSIQRTAELLDKVAKRSEKGDLYRELIGTYYNYQMAFGTIDDVAAYKRLWDKLTEPKEFHEIKLPENDGTTEFTGYISSVSDTVQRIFPNRVTYTGLTCKMTAKEPNRRPS